MPIIDNLNSIINNNELFSLKKHGLATTVGVLKGGAVGFPQDLWLKRFNYKGFPDFLLKRTFGNKAKRLFDVNKRLYEKGLPVPVPVAFIGPSFSIRHSFFLSSIIENSENLHHAYKKGLFDKNIARQLAETITRWHMAGAVHGDLKWSNILVQKNADMRNIFFVDLDQAKLYKKPKIKGIIRDLVRFYRSGLELDVKQWIDSFFMPEYMKSIPDNVKFSIDAAHIEKAATMEWHKKGQKRY